MKNLLTATLLLIVSICYGQYNYGLEVEQHDAKIEGKLNIVSYSSSIYIGKDAGIDLPAPNPGSSRANTFIGVSSGQSKLSGIHNTFVGYKSGVRSFFGSYNSCVGSNAGQSSGDYNSYFGYNAGRISGGDQNTFFGANAGGNHNVGNFNTFIGAFAGNNNKDNSNTFIGRSAGENNNNRGNVFIGSNSGESATGFQNVFIGENSGRFSVGSNQLYIENTSSTLPLIYGEFDNDLVRINGTLRITETAKLDPQSSVPSPCISTTEYGLIYYDSSGSQHVLRVCTNTGWKDMN